MRTPHKEVGRGATPQSSKGRTAHRRFSWWIKISYQHCSSRLNYESTDRPALRRTSWWQANRYDDRKGRKIMRRQVFDSLYPRKSTAIRPQSRTATAINRRHPPTYTGSCPGYRCPSLRARPRCREGDWRSWPTPVPCEIISRSL